MSHLRLSARRQGYVLAHNTSTESARSDLFDCVATLVAIGPKEHYGWRRTQLSPVRPLFLVRLARMRDESVVERLTIDILRVIRQMSPNKLRQIDVGWI